MKNIPLLLLFVSSLIYSQETITKELPSFKEIKVFNGLTVKLQKADKSRIEITGKKRNEVVVKTNDDRLKLSMKFPETLKGDEVEITLYYSEDLNLIDVNEGSIVGSKQTINQKSIELRAQEGAVVNVILKVKYLIGKAVSGGQIFTDGVVKNQDLVLTTGGIYKGYDLVSDQTYVNSSSGALAQLFVKELLNAKVSFGGTIYYKGDPLDVTTKKTFGGTIEPKE